MAARPGRLLVLAAVILVLPGCKLFRRHGSATSCREPVFTQDQGNLPPLKIPAGLDAPDTRNAVHIPELNEPERPRTKHEPCLSQPPRYDTTETPVQPTSRAQPDQPAGGR
jgi:hypothetical protein